MSMKGFCNVIEIIEQNEKRSIFKIITRGSLDECMELFDKNKIENVDPQIEWDRYWKMVEAKHERDSKK